MLKRISYLILMRRLRAEIAATIREQNAPRARTQIIPQQAGVKSTCKACGSIV